MARSRTDLFWKLSAIERKLLLASGAGLGVYRILLSSDLNGVLQQNLALLS
jgi:hypothetical protein